MGNFDPILPAFKLPTPSSLQAGNPVRMLRRHSGFLLRERRLRRGAEAVKGTPRKTELFPKKKKKNEMLPGMLAGCHGSYMVTPSTTQTDTT